MCVCVFLPPLPTSHYYIHPIPTERYQSSLIPLRLYPRLLLMWHFKHPSKTYPLETVWFLPRWLLKLYHAFNALLLLYSFLALLNLLFLAIRGQSLN